MNYRIIIYGKKSPYFYFFDERLKEYGIDAEICYINECDITEKIGLNKYYTAVIFSDGNETGTIECISEIKKRFSELPVIVVSYNSVYRICRKFIDAGAEKCIVMPVTINNICKIIMKIISDTKICISEIADFMDSFNFPRNLNGFYYLCSAVEMCVIKPDRLSDIISEIYEPVAESFGVSTGLVERSIRHFSKVSYEKGLFENFFVNGRNFRPSNHELICALSDIFVSRFDIYNKKKIIENNRKNVFSICENPASKIIFDFYYNYLY